MAASEIERSANQRANSGGAGGSCCETCRSFGILMYRPHHFNELRKSDIGATAMLAGWVHIVRDHGGVIFIDLRDREGLTQVVFRPEENAELAKEAHHLRHEDVIQVEGKVSPRVSGTDTPKLPTGDVELVPNK